MYNITMNANSDSQVGGIGFEYLTKSEIDKIKKKVLGYGNFKRFSDAIGVSRATLRDIMLKGYGSGEIVSKIRNGL